MLAVETSDIAVRTNNMLLKFSGLTAQRHLQNSRNEMETSMERLSSGKRINSAQDDAAGLAVANKLESKITGLN